MIDQDYHEHFFIGVKHRDHERRTRIVIGLTATMMVLEIAAGLLFGSMALLADGWHMASHSAALIITALGYSFARRHSSNPRFSFGTGKFGELAGYSSALLLAFIAALMAYESFIRFFSPVAISFDEAIAVAVLGLFVNLASAFLLREQQEGTRQDQQSRDHNLRSAYLHVLADALTSLLAIFALSTGRLFGWVWMDPLMGIVGAMVIARWAYHLTRDTGRILLDMNTNGELTDEIRRLVEQEPGNRISDLHVWRVGPGYFSAIVSVLTTEPRSPSHFKKILGGLKGLGHITVEVNPQEGND